MSNIHLLLFGKALVWVLLGAAYVFNDSSPNLSVALYFVVSIFFANAAIAAFLGWKFNPKNKFYFYGTLIFVLLNILLTVTDQFGFWDFVVLALDFGVLWFLFQIKCPCKK